MQEIDLSTNLISNLLGGWAGLKTLARLDLRENMIMTGLPAGWLSASAFPALVHLDLSNNVIENKLPAAWGQALKKLQYLDLALNVFREFRGCQLLGSATSVDCGAAGVQCAVGPLDLELGMHADGTCR